MSRAQANLLLLITAIIWGTAFVPQYTSMAHVGPYAFTGIRFLLEALCIAPMAWREYQRLRQRGLRISGTDCLLWLGVGLLITSGALLQQVGIPGTTVTNAGFITALYVPLVPVLVWLLQGKTPAAYVWFANLGCVAGVYLLSGGGFAALRSGDLWIMLGSLFWALHVLFVGSVASRKDTPVLLAFTQFMVCGLLSTLLAVWWEETELADVRNALPAILYGGVMSVGIGYTLQVMAQRHTPASDSALILSAEFLVAALAGAVWLDERLNAVQWGGALLILACIVAVQLLPLIGRRQAGA